MITNYLKELLNDNECVIIPEFGAFISKRHSATIDYATHRFLPPYKEIVFNDKLNNGDDILVDFISKKENISKEDSLIKIQNFVNQAAAVLDVNNEFVMEGLGKMRKFGNDYVFEMNTAENLLGDSFGLTEFNYQPVFRTETYQIIKEKIVVEQKEKNTDYTIAIESVEEVAASTRRRPSLFKTLAYTTIAFFMFFVINWTTEKSDSNLASWNPFLYSSPNEFLIEIQNLRNSSMDNGQQSTDNSLCSEIFIDNGQQTTYNSLCSQLSDFSLETVEEVVAEVAPEILDSSASQDLRISELETTEEITIAEEVVEISNEEVVAEVTPEILDSSDPKDLNSSTPEILKSYYIVGGSFQSDASAEKCLNSIKNQGFENASTLDKNDKGYIRVYYESFAEKSDALIRLDEIKSQYNESAWLLFQK